MTFVHYLFVRLFFEPSNIGRYIFVVNMIAMHVCMLIATGRYSTKLHRAYTLFYVIGTIGAIQVPVVGWTPLKSLEQLGACAVFLGIQVGVTPL